MLLAAVFNGRFSARVSIALAPLLIVAVILFSLFNAAVNVRRRCPYAPDAVFALHWCTFYLMVELIHRLFDGGWIGESIVGAEARYISSPPGTGSTAAGGVHFTPVQEC
jgi:hypothetical protein